MSVVPQLVVFTDLDGTLLDDAYSAEAASRTLERLHGLGIPLVLVSSKTRAEMLPLRDLLAPGHPFVFENGCGIAVPPGCFDRSTMRPAPALVRDAVDDDDADAASPLPQDRIERFGPDYAELRARLQRIRTDHGIPFRGFGDMSDAEVSKLTGLPLADAARARLREASEPGLLDDADGRMEEALAAFELRAVQGGRFLCVMPRADKAIAMLALRARYGPDVRTIAAGDSANDLEMLRAADHAIAVRRPDGSALEFAHADRRETELAGPAGWSRALDALLDEYGLPREPAAVDETDGPPAIADASDQDRAVGGER